MAFDFSKNALTLLTLTLWCVTLSSARRARSPAAASLSDIVTSSPDVDIGGIDINDVIEDRAATADDARDIQDPDAPGKSAIQRAVQTLLGFSDVPRKESRQPLPTNPYETSRLAPKYMLDLYERYKDGRILSGRHVANTVRSIQAEIGIVNNESMFIFNLSSIRRSERLLSSEVHIYKRRIRQASRDSDIVMQLHELAPSYIRVLDHRRVPKASYGWQAAEVTSSVRACAEGEQGPMTRFLAITFSSQRPSDGQGKTRKRNGGGMSISAIIRRLSRPYLIVFSNETQALNMDHIKTHLTPMDLTESFVDPESGIEEEFGEFAQQKSDKLPTATVPTEGAWEKGPDDKSISASSDDNSHQKHHKKKRNKGQQLHTDYHKNSNDDVEFSLSLLKKSPFRAEENEVNLRRKKRSVFDNEIPDYPWETLAPPVIYKMPQTRPDILQSRTPSRHRSPKKSSKLIPYPEDYKKRRRRKNNNNDKASKKSRRRDEPRRKSRRGGKKSRLSGDSPWDIEQVMSTRDRNQLCSKQRLVIDFADIGWSEWIISPKTFETNYCAGRCPFPLSKRVEPSNHATIQSLVHAIGLLPQVPAPCCVPDKMSSVTLLYFDENKNVVLKNYPDMTVESCGCR